ncbi:hypothetical protein BCR15_11795 [Tessaracoccus lapidicaptus]|uniref:Uncharacterized protein n=1 Tax=Tessaracoccus lapidicaptus TaxID=1427523 RepID=A0A1C0ARX2_9ACTN|nr:MULTISPECIES: hypothetical protein [Tessaracoccus]AQX15842.1 hypothetical protein BKM78_07855 [Tessaracoccus sp. T2.5-30]OCL37137.1 hypothetical protein BCR15_11795 [Tessaracoccus lapidicaptus]VEP40294.1 hypothetical protein TLA_TLA_01586 [Tessaracoccus lapidicaptus]
MEGRDTSHLEAMVAAVEALAAEGRAQLDERRVAEVHDELKRMAASTAWKLGHDALRLGELRRQHAAEMERFSEEVRRLTVDAASDRAQRLAGMVDSWRQDLLDHPDLLGPDTDLLLEADFIRSWASSDNLVEERRRPGVTWARYRVREEADAIRAHATEKVSFYTVWQNPTDHDVLVDVQSRMTVNGHLDVAADGAGVAAWFFPRPRAAVEVEARLTLWQLWSDPAPQVVADTRPIAAASAEGGFLGASDGSFVSAAPGPATTGFWVRGGSAILLESSLVVDYDALSGSVDADFAGDPSFNVGWAYATVTRHPVR